MSKKDRIVIVITAVYLLFLAACGLKPDEFFILAIPVLAYWGYRFINNDISFIRSRDDQSH